MSHPIDAKATYAIEMRCPTASGGKDWIGCVLPGDIVVTYWGPAGRISQTASKTMTVTRFNSLVQEKTAKGYQQTDEFTATTGWQSLVVGKAAQVGGSAVPVTPSKPLKSIIDEKEPSPASSINYDF